MPSDNHTYYRVSYHPPNPLYSKQEILDSLQKTVDQAWSVSEEPFILLGGDFNQLPDTDLQALGLWTEFNAPTHDGHSLDRIYVSEPHYILTYAVASSIFTKHKAVIAQNNNNNSVPCTSTDDNKTYKYVPFRKISPGQHAALLNICKPIHGSLSLRSRTLRLHLIYFINAAMIF